MTNRPDSLSGGDRQEDFFRGLADGAPLMIWMSGLDLGCYYFNRAWLDFRGRTLDQEFGNGWAEGVHPEDLQRCVSHYVACFDRRVSFAMSYRLQHHTGEYRWILDRGVPHFSPDGRFLGFFGGCAEIEDNSPITRHAELGSSLNAIKAFAQRMVGEGVEDLQGSSAFGDIPLLQKAHALHENYQSRLAEVQHAVGDLKKLATDMVSFEKISRGVCL